MSNEARRLKCIARINLLNARSAEENRHLVNKLKRILRKLEAIEE
jgi:hypothetical protein